MEFDFPKGCTGVTDGTTRDAVAVTVECFALRLVDDRVVARRVTGPLDATPDQTAVELIGLHASRLDGISVLHSTSWRWDNDDGLILTYLCCPDPCAGLATPLVKPSRSHEHQPENPSRPGHRGFAAPDVLHHGIDHFAWLAEHHPDSIATAAVEAPALWDAIRRAGHHRAGQLVDIEGGHLLDASATTSR